jgi:hypothetical protein
MRRLLFLSGMFAIVSATRADEAGFEKLFNGKDLTGWKGKADLWSVKDGAITGYTKDGNIPGGNSFLVWDGKVGNFELKTQFKIVGGNSGIQYRSKTVGDPGNFVVAGYQADIDSAGKRNQQFVGILYEERGRGFLCNRGTKTWIDAEGTRHEIATAKSDELLKAIKPDDWNDYHVIANGNHLTHKINGQTTAEVIDFQKDKRATEGLLAFQVHAGMGEMTIQFKDILLKKLPDGGEVTPEQMPIPKEAKRIEVAKPKKN